MKLFKNIKRYLRIYNIKYLILLFFVFYYLFFAVVPVFAATPPEQNPICWTKQACKDAIEGRGWTFKNNWEEKSPGDVCKGATGEAMGVCLPAGKTPLSIKIGKAVEANDLGDYIKIIYRYLVGIGAIVAVVLLIKGGFEWMTSAGSPERVKSAQSTIGNALMGLLLILGSYTLLFTINPDLVRLRLPGIYMIRKIVIGTTWCKDQTQMLALAQEKSYSPAKSLSEIKEFNISPNPKDLPEYLFSIDPKAKPDKNPMCGAKYYFKDGGDQVCEGHICPLSEATGEEVPMTQTCEKSETGLGPMYNCVKGNLSGTITAESGIPWPFIDGNLKLIGICQNNKIFLMAEIEVETLKQKTSQKYLLKLSKTSSLSPLMSSDCKPVKGFYIGAEINDESGLLGSGCDDWFAIGKSGGKCSINLTKTFLPNDKFPSCGMVNYKGNAQFVKSENLISVEELNKGIVCDMNLTRTEFPSLKNTDVTGMVCNIPDQTDCFYNKAFVFYVLH